MTVSARPSDRIRAARGRGWGHVITALDVRIVRGYMALSDRFPDSRKYRCAYNRRCVGLPAYELQFKTAGPSRYRPVRVSYVHLCAPHGLEKARRLEIDLPPVPDTPALPLEGPMP